MAPDVVRAVARAAPEYMSLLEVVSASDDPQAVRITGRTGTINSIAAYVTALEASPTLRMVHPEMTMRVLSEVNPDEVRYEFRIRATYEGGAGVAAPGGVPSQKK